MLARVEAAAGLARPDRHGLGVYVQDMRLSLLGWAGLLGDRDMAVLLLRFGGTLEKKDVVRRRFGALFRWRCGVRGERVCFWRVSRAGARPCCGLLQRVKHQWWSYS